MGSVGYKKVYSLIGGNRSLSR